MSRRRSLVALTLVALTSAALAFSMAGPMGSPTSAAAAEVEEPYGVAGRMATHTPGFPAAEAGTDQQLTGAYVEVQRSGIVEAHYAFVGPPKYPGTTVGWGIGIRRPTGCEVAVSGTAKSNNNGQEWVAGGPSGPFRGTPVVTSISTPFDPAWNCVVAWTQNAAGVRLDEMSTDTVTLSQVPRVSYVSLAWWGRPMVVPRNRWVRLPLTAYPNYAARAGGATVTLVGGSRNEDQPVRVESWRHRYWVLAKARFRGKKQRTVRAVVTPDQGVAATKKFVVRTRGSRPRLRPGRYAAWVDGRAVPRRLRFQVTRSGRVKGLHHRLDVDLGGSGGPVYQGFRLPGFTIPRSGFATAENFDAAGKQNITVLNVNTRTTASVLSLYDIPFGPGSRLSRARWIGR